MDSQRFFIALVPPPEIQVSVNDIKHHFEAHYGARKALNSPPHVTLQAPFLWANQRELTEGVKRFAQERPGVAIALRNFGAFAPRVIYVDVVKSPGLMALQKDLSAFVQTRYGIIDRRYANFRPHMTVAFRDLSKAAFHQAWPEFEQKPFQHDFLAQKLTLLRHDGQRWQIYQDFPFDPAMN